MLRALLSLMLAGLLIAPSAVLATDGDDENGNGNGSNHHNGGNQSQSSHNTNSNNNQNRNENTAVGVGVGGTQGQGQEATLTNVHVNMPSAIAPSVSAPNLAVAPETCMGSVSAGLSGASAPGGRLRRPEVQFSSQPRPCPSRRFCRPV